MRISLRRDLPGYATDAIAASGVDGTGIVRPFVLLTGPNGCGKSALLRAIRASMGLRGERMGSSQADFGEKYLDMAQVDGDLGRGATTATGIGRSGHGAAGHVPAVVDVTALGWTGQDSYLFDSRAASAMASKADLGDDMEYHVSLIMNGGKNVSHGQFVQKTWQEALHWAAGLADVRGGWPDVRVGSPRRGFLDAALGGVAPSTERWLFLDEPETAIDAEALLLGMSVLLELAEEGRLRVFCASHSLLFAAGLARNPKIQTIDMGGKQPWLRTQEIALTIAGDREKVGSVGRDILSRMRARHSRRT